MSEVHGVQFGKSFAELLKTPEVQSLFMIHQEKEHSKRYRPPTMSTETGLYTGMCDHP